MTPEEFIRAARVPESLKPQTFGPWKIERWREKDASKGEMTVMKLFALAEAKAHIGFESYTLLRRHSWATIHLENSPEVVMEDSRHELRKHLHARLIARFRNNVTTQGAWELPRFVKRRLSATLPILK
jgi:L-amino acid N-acyltransferase YncA